MKSAISTANESRVQDLHRYLRAISANEHIDVDSAFVPAALRDVQRRHPGLDGGQALRLLLDEGLMSLRQSDPHHADLLEGRFWQGLTVAQMVMAQRPEPQSERRFYQQQARAIARLSETLTAFNHACESTQRIQNHLHVLPLPTYDRLVGVDDVIAHVRALLTTPDKHFVVMIKGIGGIGKTAVADAVVRSLDVATTAPGGFVWVSVKQRILTPAGAIAQPSPVFVDELLDQVATQLNLQHLKQLSAAEKLAGLASRLRSIPHLVVIDGLEDSVDVRESTFVLERLAGPTKFLLISRVAFPRSTSFTVVELGELEQHAAIELVTQLVSAQGIELSAPEMVYAVTGGHPLAIVLTVGQMTLLPPRQVLAGMRSGALPDVFDHLYRRAWSLLTTSDLDLLLTIMRTGESADADWLALLYRGDEHVLFRSLQALTNLSLVHVERVSGDRRRYTLHRVTSMFLGTGVLEWKSADWRGRLYGGYQRDGRRLLAQINRGNLDHSVIELGVNLLRTYTDMVYSIPGEHAPESTLLELAIKIHGHAMKDGRWTEIRLIWPGLRNLASQSHHGAIYVELTWQLAMVLDRQGDGPSAVRLYEELSRSSALHGLGLRHRASFLLHAGTAYLWHGHYPAAEEALNLALQTIGQDPEPADSILVDQHGYRLSGQPAPIWELEAYLLSQLGNLMMFRGNFEEAERLYQHSLAVIVHHDGEDNLACVAYQALGRFYLYGREYDRAATTLQHGLQIRRRRAEQEGIAVNSIYLAAACLGIGQMDQAGDLLMEATQICTQLGNLRDLTLAHLHLGHACWLQNDIQRAADHWTQVLEHAETIYFHDLELDLLSKLPTSPRAISLPDELLVRIRQFMRGRTSAENG